MTKRSAVREITVNEFRSNLKASVDEVIQDHAPLRVTRRTGEDFVVIGAQDWESEQETLYVLQNQSLMRQIAASLRTHQKGTGYTPSPEELDALDHV
ncbi:MAG TPA: type II toxin-antitoxin system Phd/YefM family antitoxin [Thermoanaerobaculia bacterium]|nr:type II toxin-antitoxin system Phd/YefM family antitoxin [Thermoanaerobaculia bacterium]